METEQAEMRAPLPARDVGLEPSFLLRVYRTSATLAALAPLFYGGGMGERGALGWLAGVGVSLTSLLALHFSVVRFARPGVRSRIGLTLMMLARFPLLFALTALILWFAARGWLSVPWIAAGVALPHTVLLLKLGGLHLSRRMAALGERSAPARLSEK